MPQGPKGIIAANLIRIGVAHGDSPGCAGSGAYKSAWSLKSKKELHTYWDSLHALWIDGPFGPFRGLLHILGPRKAQFVCRRDGIPFIPNDTLGPLHPDEYEPLRSNPDLDPDDPLDSDD